jgi:hypothetical protein
MSRSRRRPSAGTTHCPETERAYLAGLLELLVDDPPRCRAALQLVDESAFTIDAGAGLFAAIAQAAALEAPTLADVCRIARERATEPAADGGSPEVDLATDIAKAFAGKNRGAYSFGVDRHGREIAKAAGKRRTIEAATVAVAVAADPQATAEEIEAAARGVAAASASMPTEQLEWEPLPVELLPEPVRSFVIEAAEALTTDPVFVALPLLASVAATIGGRRRIELWPGYQVPSILWTATVAGSGSMKTPAAAKALAFIRERQRDAFAAHRAAVATWEQEKREHEAARRSGQADVGGPPARPAAERFLVDDVTIEGLGPILAENPAGVLVSRDELSGWFDFDRYSGGKGGAEVGRWLSCYDAEPLTVDRKLSGTLYVPAALVSIAGGIQPAILARVVGSRHVENGLLQRFILAAPPKRMKEIPASDVGFATMQAMRDMFATLAAIPIADSPRILDLEPEALDAFHAFYREHAVEQFHAEGAEAGMLAKAEGWAARLALVCQMISQAGSDPGRGDRVQIDSMQAGIGLARWAAREWRRVFDGMQRGAADDDDAALRRWLAARGGIATPRDVARGLAKYRAPGAAEAALSRLAKAGAAQWQAQATGGRPADAVRLK